MLSLKRSGHCLFTTLSCALFFSVFCFFFHPAFFFFFFESLTHISESPHRICSDSSGASGQTPGQRLTYFIGLSGRRDRSNTTRLDSEEKEEEEEEGKGGELGRRGSANPPPPAPSVCHIPSPRHILRRAETASHAETNVKINRFDLSCSALTCSPLVTFASQLSPARLPLLQIQKKGPLYKINSIPLLHFRHHVSPLSAFPGTVQHSRGFMGRAREQLLLMSHLDDEVRSWRGWR